MIPDRMSGVYLTGHGGPEMLDYRRDIPVPRPGPGEVLVRVLAAGVNNTDINTRTGWYSKSVTGATDASGVGEVEAGGYAGALNFPLIQGGDLCGEVVATGDGAGDFAIGARVTCGTNQPVPGSNTPVAIRVIGSEYDGAFAQFCVVPADQLRDVSASPLSDVEIGAMPCAFGTAMALLDRARVTGTDRVFVTGASGGVGMAAVQLAALRGAEVIAQASAAKADAVRQAGASAVLDRGAVPEAGMVTAVIDLVGGPGWRRVIDALEPGGRYGVAGAIAGPMVEADLRTIYLNDLSILGVTFQPPESIAALVALINEGAVRPLVSKTYPMSEIAQAQADFAAKTYPGKLVLIPEGAE